MKEISGEDYSGGIEYMLDLVWLACAIDGEGSICMLKQHYCPIVSVTNTKYEFVEKAAKLMETKIIPTHHDFTNRKAAFVTKEWNQSKVKLILSEILPFLLIKKRQAELILEFIEIRKNSKYGKGIRGGMRSERETEIYNELKELNRRGL